MALRDRFTAEEWRTLEFGPFWMFSAIVGAYRRFDQLEYEAFVGTLQAAALAGEGLGRELLDAVLAELWPLTEAYGADDRTIAVGLGQVAAVLDRVARDQAAAVKGLLVVEIGEGVARARGRFGRVMSEEDANAVTLAAQLLYYDRYDAAAS